MKKILALLIAATVTGCSTITNGSNEELSFSSHEEGTKLYINGQYRGNDYTNITVERGKRHTVIAKKKGCKQSVVTTDYSFQWGKSLVLNVLIDFGIFTIPTDLLTKAAWQTTESHYDVTPICEVNDSVESEI
ncbi:hypothetical protein L4C36_11440 [Photobacterium japonica]|uniref:hypothetical protein n=1 Tax=Photobacterium japonica TaxID=2910235 RepID=UPI003D0C2ECD